MLLSLHNLIGMERDGSAAAQQPHPLPQHTQESDEVGSRDCGLVYGMNAEVELPDCEENLGVCHWRFIRGECRATL